MKHKKDKFGEFEDQARDLHPNDDENQYEVIFAKVMEFATRRRLDANQARMKGDLMDCNRVGPEADQSQHGCQQQDQQAYPEQYNYEGYDVNYGGYNIKEANYGGGVSPYSPDQHQHPSDIDAFGKGKGKGQDTRLCWICGKKGHISRDCRSPKAIELRAKGVIKGSSKCGQWEWGKGKGKGKGKYGGYGGYGGKGKGVYEMEQAWEDQPEGEVAGEIQALGGGIYSVEKNKS